MPGKMKYSAGTFLFTQPASVTMNILIFSLFIIVCLGVSGCAASKQSCGTAGCHKCETAQAPVDPAEAREKLLRLTATVDGSGRIIINGDSARYEHKFWTPPWNVTFDGEAWADLSQTPSGWSTLSRQLDLPRARIVSRSGRDVIALEPTAEGFDLFLNDTPNGADDYSVIITIPFRDGINP
jgi:hypothetical protein